MKGDFHQTIARVRRAMPRNADVMELCDELERRLATKPRKTRAEIQRAYRLRKKAITK